LPGLFYFRQIMSEYLLHNGNFCIDGDYIIAADNRGLRYGDGLFETLRTTGKKIHFMNWHFERLFSGLQMLEFELASDFTPSNIASQVFALCKRNRHPAARVRINVIRGDGGGQEDRFAHCIIQSQPLPGKDFQLNGNGLVLGIYQGARKTMDAFSNIKSNNYLPYTMAALQAEKNKWDDALVLNVAGRICDAAIANVFIIKNEILYTPPLQEGCVAGIMRRNLLENLATTGYYFHEKEITIEDLLAADEVFLTNAVKGIRWVSHCGDAVYTNRITTGIFTKLLRN